jgi:excisionase family DNA binding protein
MLACDVRPLARLLGCSAETLYCGIREGRIFSTKIGSRRRVIPLRVVEDLIGGPLSPEAIAELTGEKPKKAR